MTSTAVDPVTFLRATEPFSGLPDALFDEVAAALEVTWHPAGTRLCRAGGEPMEHLYVIRKGVVRLERDGQTLQLAEEGESVGDVSLISQVAALAAVVEEELVAYRIPAATFRRLLGEPRSYAEHWLSFWNDLLRNDYAGTGYIDGGRKQISGWLYKSLAANKPYDQFVRELISPTAESEGFVKGIKWRAYNPATTRIAAMVGAQPMTIQAAELTQALSTGVVDSFMSSGATGVDSKVWESLTHFATVDAWLPKNMVIINQKEFDKLDKPTQDAVLAAGKAAEERGWKRMRDYTTESLTTLRNNKMTVYEPNAAFKAELTKLGETMLKEWLEKAKDDGQAIINAYRK